MLNVIPTTNSSQIQINASWTQKQWPEATNSHLNKTSAMKYLHDRGSHDMKYSKDHQSSSLWVTVLVQHVLTFNLRLDQCKKPLLTDSKSRTDKNAVTDPWEEVVRPVQQRWQSSFDRSQLSLSHLCCPAQIHAQVENNKHTVSMFHTIASYRI